MSGYFDACLRALSDQGHDLYLVDLDPSPEAPFSATLGNWIARRRTWDGCSLDTDGVLAELRQFSPGAILISSWHIAAYRSIAKGLAGTTIRVLCMDNWWIGSFKQWAGRMGRSVYLAPYFDLAFVPGLRQWQFARMLGFADNEIIPGLYSADTGPFYAHSARRSVGKTGGAPREFLFVGRLVPEKGVLELLQAYDTYRSRSKNPWCLRIAGTGPLVGEISTAPGVDYMGFCQPEELPQLMSRSDVFVLPSKQEHWGVVVHEAAAAGMVLCCTTAVPAGDQFLQDGYNGLLVPPGDALLLSEALLAFGRMGDGELTAMSEGSQGLSRQLSTEQWARHLIYQLNARRPDQGVASKKRLSGRFSMRSRLGRRPTL